MTKLWERPEDNIVRTVVRTLVTYFHPEFQDEAKPATFAQLKSDPLKTSESDMRWILPKHRSTNSNEAVRPQEVHQSNSTDERALPGKE